MPQAVAGGTVPAAIGDGVMKLLASDASERDWFGSPLAVSGDTALIAAPYDDDKDSASGSVYVFVRSGTTWMQQQKLTASDGARDDEFGRAVAIWGDTIVAAYSDDDWGAAHVFARSGNLWAHQQNLVASDGDEYDSDSPSVDVFGDTAILGVWYDDDRGGNAGAAYGFTRRENAWTLQQKLRAPDGARSDWFGVSVALSGDTALIGASGDDNTVVDAGAVYVFERSGSTWAQQHKLMAPDARAEDYFGSQLGFLKDSAVVGLSRWGENAAPGSAYLYTRTGSTWSHERNLTAPDSTPYDWFAESVALSDHGVMVSATGDEDGGADGCGSVYVFSDAPVPGTHSLVYTPGQGGVIWGASYQVVPTGFSGSTVDAWPYIGYRFVSWSDGLTNYRRTDRAITSSLALSASFEKVLKQAKIVRSPSKTSLTYRRAKGAAKFTLAATIKGWGDEPIKYTYVVLQTSKTGKSGSWRDAYWPLTTSKGKASQTVRTRTAGVRYYRWYVPFDSETNLATYSPKIKVTVR